MEIPATPSRISEAASAAVALRTRTGLIDRMIQLVRRTSPPEEAIVQADVLYYPLWIGTTEIRSAPDGVSGPVQVRLFAVDGCTGAASRIEGCPQPRQTQAEGSRVALCRITAEEAMRLLAAHLRRPSVTPLRRACRARIRGLLKIYKPHYIFLIKAGRGSVFRAVDAETGLRNYALDVLFRTLSREPAGS